MEKKIECEYTYEELTNALALMPTIKYHNLVIIGALFTVIGIILKIFDMDDNLIKICGTLILSLGVFILLLGIFNVPCIKKKLFLKNIKKANQMYSDGIKYEYTFYDDYFYINVISTKTNSNSTVSYSSIVRITKNKDNIYMLINNVNAYMLKKNCLNEEEFNELLSKMPAAVIEKYKKENKNKAY